MTTEKAIEFGKIFLKTIEDEKGSATYEFVETAVKMMEQEQPKWIPVSERLPKDGETVIASAEDGVYPETRFIKKCGWEWAYEAGADYWVPLNLVKAWMPLPKPYKIESEVEE